MSFVVRLQSCHHDVHHMYTKTCGKHTEVIACVVVRRCCSVVSYGGQYSVLSRRFVMDMMIKDFTAFDSSVDFQAHSGTGDGHHLCLDDIDSDFDIFANLSFFANFGCTGYFEVCLIILSAVQG